MSIYGQNDAHLKMQLLDYVNDYIESMRKSCSHQVFVVDGVKRQPDREFLATQDLPYLENYAIQLFSKMLEAVPEQINLSLEVQAELSRVARLRFMPDEIKASFAKFASQYNDANLAEREHEVLTIHNKIAGLPNMMQVMSEVYINDMRICILQVVKFCKNHLSVGADTDAIMHDLTQSNLALRDAMDIKQGTPTLKEENIEMVLNILDPLVNDSRFNPVGDKLHLANRVLRAVLNAEFAGLNYSSSLNNLILDLSTSNLKYRLQQAWLRRLRFSSSEAVMLIITLIHLAYKINYDQDVSSRICILAGMNFYRTRTLAIVQSHTKEFCIAECLLLRLLKFNAHLTEEKLMVQVGGVSKLRMYAS